MNEVDKGPGDIYSEEDGEGGEAGDVEHFHCGAVVELGAPLDEGEVGRLGKH